MTKSADVLVVSAHPDDIEFGVAGTVARWTEAGKQVAYVVCTSGDKGTTDRSLTTYELMRLREEEQREAARCVGVGEVVFLRHRDQELEDTPDFRKEIVRQIRTYRPQIVVTSDPYRRYIWHRDHRVVGQVTLDAIFPFARDHMAYPDLLEKGLEPHKVKEVWFWAAEEVNHRSDISPTFERKLAALRCHRTQEKDFGIRDLEQWLRERCREMAAGTGYAYAEAFHREIAPP